MYGFSHPFKFLPGQQPAQPMQPMQPQGMPFGAGFPGQGIPFQNLPFGAGPQGLQPQGVPFQGGGFSPPGLSNLPMPLGLPGLPPGGVGIPQPKATFNPPPFPGLGGGLGRPPRATPSVEGLGGMGGRFPGRAMY